MPAAACSALRRAGHPKREEITLAKPVKILLEDCRGDRYLMLSHFHQLWRTDRFRTFAMEGEPEDREEDRGVSLKPGMGEIPFCLLMAQLPVRTLSIHSNGMMLRASVAPATLEAVCLTEETADAARTMKEQMPLLRRPRTHVKPDTIEERVSSHRNLVDPLCQLFERARSLPFFEGKLHVALSGESSYTLCGQPLPAGSKGAFYGFNQEYRAFVAYDTYSDRLVGYGPVRQVTVIR